MVSGPLRVPSDFLNLLNSILILDRDLNLDLPDYVLAAGRDFALSKIVAAMLDGTGSNMNGSIEYAARPFDNDRIAVA